MPENNGQNVTQNQMLFEKSILRIEDVAVILGLKKSYIYQLTSQKKIPFKKRGKTLYFMSKDLFDWINEGVS